MARPTAASFKVSGVATARPSLRRRVVYRRPARLLTAAGGARRPGVDGGDLVPRRVERAKSRHGERRGSHECETQTRHVQALSAALALRALVSLRRMMPRRTADR